MKKKKSKKSAFKKPILEKLGVQKLNPIKAVLKGATGHRLVREVETPEIVEDRSSLFFKKSFVDEEDRNKKWLVS